MASPLRADNRADYEARVAFGLAAACAVAFGAFVLVPYYITDVYAPAGLDALWMLGTIFSVLLGPVIAGIAAYTSFVTLWLHARTLPAQARRLHLITLVVAVVFLVLFLTLGADVISGWAD